MSEKSKLRNGAKGYGTEMNDVHPGTVTFHEDVVDEAEEKEYTLVGQYRTALLTLWQIKLLLVFAPLAIIGKLSGAADGPLFFFSFLALIPLAALLGDFTEDICKRSNEVVGALINVTFGNATELIISFVALKAGMFQLIKSALIGSILGNMLLVLGTGLFLGGLRRKILSFSQAATNTYTPLLMMAVMSFLIPSGYGLTTAKTTPAEAEVARLSVLAVSRQIALVTAFVYVAYLWFQLVTHKEVFDDEAAGAVVTPTEELESGTPADDEDEEDDTPEFTLMFAVTGLAAVSILISYISDVLVDSVEGAAKEYSIPDQFIGLILVPIVGNAAEHATAVIMARKGRLDVAIGVALGSSIQIALFVMPVLVLLGWVIGVPLDMNFHPFPTAVLMICTMVACQVVGDGKSNWLEGVMLIGAYVMVSITVFQGNI